MLNLLTNLFPVWVLAGAVLALAKPELFTWFSGPMIPWGLAVIMLGMGLTLSPKDFEGVIRDPKRVALGVMLQYTVMPFLGWLLGYLFRLPMPLAAGLILVSACPGGTASNVVAFIAKADVALSVTMTSVSTLLAVLMTPTLTAWLAGSRIDVNGWGLFWSTVQVVILPVLTGVLLNKFIPSVTRRILPASPLVAVIFITLIVASIVGQGKAQIFEAGWTLIAAVFCLHAFGFGLGYAAAAVVARDRMTSRTVSIEVGMQNSGLGAVLARQNFADPLVAIPSAISSVFHSVIASALAGIWNRTDRP
ncbi:MAG: bile acid:sodium symporter family protein [Candidatus Omnitrophica bacterium]|jgi:BASS family bile acid:Na+ symporter|nr:bile acid:sodium symporter family protein [Candidatus Omnitrophota bacterium]